MPRLAKFWTSWFVIHFDRTQLHFSPTLTKWELTQWLLVTALSLCTGPSVVSPLATVAGDEPSFCAFMCSCACVCACVVVMHTSVRERERELPSHLTLELVFNQLNSLNLIAKTKVFRFIPPTL